MVAQYQYLRSLALFRDYRPPTLGLSVSVDSPGSVDFRLTTVSITKRQHIGVYLSDRNVIFDKSSWHSTFSTIHELPGHPITPFRTPSV